LFSLWAIGYWLLAISYWRADAGELVSRWEQSIASDQ
jgi:hypothetical protein